MKDAGQAKGRHRRIGIVHVALALLMLGVLAKAAHVQLVHGSAWASLAQRQHFTATEVPAPRGHILDATGQVLATTREVVRLEVAPREVRDRDRLRRALLAAKVDRQVAAKVTDASRAWVTIPGSFVAEDIAAITAMRGVYTTPVSDRTYSISPGLRPLLGRVRDGRGTDGLELTLDSLLQGTAGAAQMARSVGGKSFISPTAPGHAATPGHTVVLTINHELQEIAERTLADAVRRMEADGGDIVIMDPNTGELLAMAGERNGRVAASVTALTEPFEPGSTLKPLIAAGLLARGRARPGDVVPALGGKYTLHGRTIHDEPHDGPTPARLTLADVIRYSSNVGIVQFAERLTPREEFETLRDFGLGTPTGLAYAAEAAGTLRPPQSWSRQSQASLAMGYEIAVTPVQLAAAYAAIANGGELLEPALIREVRDPEGDVRYRHERRVVRRVVPDDVARTLRGLLTDVVARGTAVQADLATHALGGKTGTPRRTVNGRYAPGEYNPNFVGLFPADAPQLVVVVKLTNPQGSYYGGRTAAPMTKTILQAALAARDAALDRSQLTTAAARQAGRALAPAAAVAEAEDVEVRADTSSRVLVQLPPAPPKTEARPARAVPNVRGLTLRDAVRSLHDAGFRVQLARRPAGPAATPTTEPAAGVVVAAGSLVRLRYHPE